MLRFRGIIGQETRAVGKGHEFCYEFYACIILYFWETAFTYGGDEQRAIDRQ